ncbi:MAG: hypothetical protein ACYS1A_07460 [Planctomycetota bacterium]|jgi:hypothetical protein
MADKEIFEKNLGRLIHSAGPELRMPDEKKSQILEKLTGAGAVPEAQKPESIWRIILKSRITKLAVAAVIIIAVMIGINHFGGSIDVTSVAWGEVRSAFLEQLWVHLIYDNGEESWYNLKTGNHCHKQLYTWGDSFVYINRTDNLRQWYTPEHGQHIREDRPAIYPDDIVPEYEPKTAWERIVGHWEKIAKQNDSSYYEVEIRPDTLNRKNVVRFDIYYIDALEQRLLTKQLWANPLTKLPIKIRRKLTAQQRKDQNREYTTGTFAFPETGPKSIYDLGVSKNLPITKDYDKTANPSIEEIIETAKQYYEDFPKRCRAVIWQNERESEIEVVWRNGEQIRFNHYFNMEGPQYSEYHLELPTTVDQILQWIKTQPPISIYMDDGIKSYHRSYHPAFEDLKTPKVRVTKSWRKGLPEKAHFIEENWEYMDRDVKAFQFIDDAPESLRQYIGIKTESGDIRRDYYIDSEHDYILFQNIWWQKQKGKWEKEREYFVTELSQVPDGQWFISKRKLITYGNQEKGTSGWECNYNIDLTLLEKNEFPPDTFNADLLLEDARIETY